MSDPLPLDEALAYYRKSIQMKKQKLQELTKEYTNLANGEQDLFRKNMANRISQYAEIMNDLYSNIEIRATANASFQVKLEGLRDIVYELKEVKESPEIQRNIRELFLNYKDRF
jgi:hypothetical protein